MIEIPKCFRCRYYNDGKCKAFPKGIPLPEVARKPISDECADGIKYEKK